MGHYDDIIEEREDREREIHERNRKAQMLERRLAFKRKLDTLSDDDLLFVEQIALDAASYRAFFKILSTGGPKL